MTFNPDFVRRKLEFPPARVRSLPQRIGAVVRELRLIRGRTIANLAAEAELSVGMLSKIENGATTASLTSLQSLADALKVPISELFQRCEAIEEAVHMSRAVIDQAAQVRDSDLAICLDLGVFATSAGEVRTTAHLIVMRDTPVDLTQVAADHAPGGLAYVSVLSGAVQFDDGDAVRSVQAGDLLVFPLKDGRAQVCATGDDGARLLMIYASAARPADMR